MNKRLKFIAWFEIASGIIGAVYVLLFGGALLQAPGGMWALLLFGAVALVSFFAGLLLLKTKQAGLLLSRFVQVIQLPVVSFTPLLYYLGLGLFFGFGVYVPTVKGNSLSLAFYTQVGPWR